MQIEFKSAIYKITNVANGKCYIGSAVDVYTRIAVHKSGLKYGTQPNKHLQASYNKHGFINFKFEVLEYVSDKHKLLHREQLWINYFKSCDPKFGYNKRKIPNSNLGIKRKHSSETKAKIGKSNSISLLGAKHSETTKAKMSKSHKGVAKSDAHKLALKKAWELRRLTYGENGRSV